MLPNVQVYNNSATDNSLSENSNYGSSEQIALDCLDLLASYLFQVNYLDLLASYLFQVNCLDLLASYLFQVNVSRSFSLFRVRQYRLPVKLCVCLSVCSSNFVPQQTGFLCKKAVRGRIEEWQDILLNLLQSSDVCRRWFAANYLFNTPNR